MTLDAVIALVESHGFYRVKDDYGDVTFWTCDDWAGWWEGDPPTRRKMFLLEVLADIIGRESGWNAIRHQPK